MTRSTGASTGDSSTRSPRNTRAMYAPRGGVSAVRSATNSPISIQPATVMAQKRSGRSSATRR